MLIYIDLDGDHHSGVVRDFVETAKGAGYRLVSETGGLYMGTDETLCVQCSWGGGVDPASQCEELASAEAMFCLEHQATVDALYYHLDKPLDEE